MFLQFAIQTTFDTLSTTGLTSQAPSPSVEAKLRFAVRARGFGAFSLSAIVAASFDREGQTTSRVVAGDEVVVFGDEVFEQRFIPTKAKSVPLLHLESQGRTYSLKFCKNAIFFKAA